VEKAAYAAQSSTAAADAAFAAAKGAVVGPVRGSLGFVVAKVDSVEQVPGRSLAQAHDEIAAALTGDKTKQIMSDIQDKLGGAFDNNATFAEAVADQKLQAQTTGGLTAQGINPDQPEAKPDPALAPIVSAAFAMQDGDAPTVVQTAADGSYAVVAVDRVIPAAPRPLTAVREQVAKDFDQNRRQRAARQIAAAILAKANGGTALAQAFSGAGVSLPAPKPLAAARADLARNREGAPPPLVLLFNMAQGTAKLLEAPQGQGWYVIKLDKTIAGNAQAQPRVAMAARREIGKGLGREYVQALTNAIRKSVGVELNDKAIAAVRTSLTSNGGSDQ
jgi:peptidyl-prolyl cis-trans isomerase D